MKILNVEKQVQIVYKVSFDSGTWTEYERTENGDWFCHMGESLEPAYYVDDIEKKFQKYLKKHNLKCEHEFVGSSMGTFCKLCGEWYPDGC